MSFSDSQLDRSSRQKRLLNIKETADYLGIEARTIYNGTGPKAKNPFPVRPKRIGKKILFDLKDLESYVNSL